MAIADSPGWNESGGPWVKPNQAMKKLVWSETIVVGGQAFHGTLAAIPFQMGPFGNLAQSDLMGAMGGSDAPPPSVDFGAETVVIVFRQPAEDISMAQRNPVVTTSGGGKLEAVLLSANDLNQSVLFPAAASGQKSWIQYEFATLQTTRAVTLAMGGPGDSLAQFQGETGDGPVLESSDDGTIFATIVRLPRLVQCSIRCRLSQSAPGIFVSPFSKNPKAMQEWAISI